MIVLGSSGLRLLRTFNPLVAGSSPAEAGFDQSLSSVGRAGTNRVPQPSFLLFGSQKMSAEKKCVSCVGLSFFVCGHSDFCSFLSADIVWEQPNEQCAQLTNQFCYTIEFLWILQTFPAFWTFSRHFTDTVKKEEEEGKLYFFFYSWAKKGFFQRSATNRQ